MDNNIFTICNDIEKLYFEFLSNFSKLELTFNLKQTIEKAMLFQYMLNEEMFLANGINIEKPIELSPIFTEEDSWQYLLFTGRNVCRHNAKAMQDVLRFTGDISMILYGISKIDVSFSKYISENDKKVIYYLKKELKEGKIEFTDYIVALNELSIKYKAKYLKQKEVENSSFTPNHVINVIENNDELYLIDPSLDQIYEKVRNHSHFYRSKDLYYFLLQDASSLWPVLFYDEDEAEALSILFSTFPLGNVKNAIKQKDKIFKMCADNLDILDRFTIENNPIYSDISQKCLSLTRKRNR